MYADKILRKRSMYKLASLFLMVVVLVSGCASVPMEDPKKSASLKKFSTKSDKAGLCIYINEAFGGAILMDLKIDGKLQGQTAPYTFFYKEVEPGKHSVTSVAENTDSVIIDAIAGKLYYIWQEVKMGLMMARSKLNIMPENEGKKGVLETALAKSQEGQIVIVAYLFE